MCLCVCIYVHMPYKSYTSRMIVWYHLIHFSKQQNDKIAIIKANFLEMKFTNNIYTNNLISG